MKLGLVPALLLALFTGQAGQGVHATYRSTDGGKTWARASEGLPESARVNAYAAADGAILAGSDAGLYVSRDRAASWTSVPGVTARVLSLAVSGRQVFAGTHGNGLLQSDDGGRSWARSQSFPGQDVLSLVSDGAAVYAGTNRQGVLASYDRGLTWTAMSEGLPEDSQVFALAVAGGQLYAGLYAKGLYVCQALTGRWVRSGDVVPLVLASGGSTLVAGHNPGGIYWGPASGERWSKAVSAGDWPVDAPVWAMGAGNGVVVAGAAAGVYLSEDGGRSWTHAVRGLPADAPGIAFLVDDGLMLASTLQGSR